MASPISPPAQHPGAVHPTVQGAEEYSRSTKHAASAYCLTTGLHQGHGEHLDVPVLLPGLHRKSALCTPKPEHTPNSKLRAVWRCLDAATLQTGVAQVYDIVAHGVHGPGGYRPTLAVKDCIDAVERMQEGWRTHPLPSRRWPLPCLAVARASCNCRGHPRSRACSDVSKDQPAYCSDLVV